MSLGKSCEPRIAQFGAADENVKMREKAAVTLLIPVVTPATTRAICMQIFSSFLTFLYFFFFLYFYVVRCHKRDSANVRRECIPLMRGLN